VIRYQAFDKRGKVFGEHRTKEAASFSKAGNAPLFRLSSQGVVETKFNSSGELINRYAARPDGAVIMIHSDGSTKLIDNFAPDGTRDSSVAPSGHGRNTGQRSLR